MGQEAPGERPLAAPASLGAGSHPAHRRRQHLAPAYMTRGQMTLISAAYLLLVSAGIAWLWQRWPWAGTLSAVGLVAAMLYSSANYYQSPSSTRAISRHGRHRAGGAATR